MQIHIGGLRGNSTSLRNRVQIVRRRMASAKNRSTPGLHPGQTPRTHPGIQPVKKRRRLFCQTLDLRILGPATSQIRDTQKHSASTTPTIIVLSRQQRQYLARAFSIIHIQQQPPPLKTSSTCLGHCRGGLLCCGTR